MTAQNIKVMNFRTSEEAKIIPTREGKLKIGSKVYEGGVNRNELLQLYANAPIRRSPCRAKCVNADLFLLSLSIISDRH